MPRAAGDTTKKTRTVHRRAERPEDGPFRLDLFRDTHGGLLAGLDRTLVDMLLLQQFAGQASTYRARYPDARHDIIEVDGTPVGRMVTDQTTDEITLVDIALLAAHRGRGIGTRLLRELIAEARGGGLGVRLSVRCDNVDARRLYERLGFVEVGASEMDIAMAWDRRRAPYPSTV